MISNKLKQFILLLTIMVVNIAFGFYIGHQYVVDYTPYKTAMKYYADRNDPALLRPFVEQLMEAYNVNISPARRDIIIEAFLRVANRTFENEEHKRHFAALLGKESHFHPDIQSSKAGAVGIAQIMPKYAKEFAKNCNMKDFSVDKDLRDMEINMMLGACLYKELLQVFDNNPAAALAAYNGGRHAKAISQLEKGASISNLETASYVANNYYQISKAKGKLGISE